MAMSSRVHSPVSYVMVLAVLIVLTCLTVGLSFLPLQGPWHLVVGLLIAVIKASLVGLFFMHLIDSRPTIWAVVLVSLFWATIVLMGLTFADYATRSWAPFVPGH
jgi:cytochrome c oxidase subunit 4